MIIRSKSDFRIAVVGEGEDAAEFKFRNPTTEEHNGFVNSQFRRVGDRNESNYHGSREAFFDLLIVEISGAVDTNGEPWTVDRKGEIENEIKVVVVNALFDTAEHKVTEKK